MNVLLQTVVPALLDPYFEKESLKELSASFLGSSIEARNVSLLPDALEKLGITSIRIRHGSIKHLKINIPGGIVGIASRRVLKEPVRIEISGVNLLVEGLPTQTPDEIKQSAIKSRIQKLLDDRTLYRQAILSLLESVLEGQLENKISTRGFVELLVENGQVELSDIHIRFEDPSLGSRAPCILGVLLRSFTTRNCEKNSDWSGVPRTEGIQYRIANIDGLCMYYSSLEQSQYFTKLPRKEILPAFSNWYERNFRHLAGAAPSSSPVSYHTQEVEFLLLPINTETLIAFNWDSKVPNQPLLDVSALCHSLNLFLTGKQIQSFLQLSSVMLQAKQTLHLNCIQPAVPFSTLFRLYRPRKLAWKEGRTVQFYKQNPKYSPSLGRDWCRFFIAKALIEAGEPIEQLPWSPTSDLEQRWNPQVVLGTSSRRKQYVTAYKKLLHAEAELLKKALRSSSADAAGKIPQTGDPSIEKELSTLEEVCPMPQIYVFRDLARAEFEAELRAKEQARAQTKSQSSGVLGWLWRSSSPTQPQIEELSSAASVDVSSALLKAEGSRRKRNTGTVLNVSAKILQGGLVLATTATEPFLQMSFSGKLHHAMFADDSSSSQLRVSDFLVRDLSTNLSPASTSDDASQQSNVLPSYQDCPVSKRTNVIAGQCINGKVPLRLLQNLPENSRAKDDRNASDTTPLISASLDVHPFDAPETDIRVRLKIEPIFLIASTPFFVKLLRFFDSLKLQEHAIVSSIADATSNIIESLKDSLMEDTYSVLAHATKWDLDVQLSAPTLILPVPTTLANSVLGTPPRSNASNLLLDVSSSSLPISSKLPSNVHSNNEILLSPLSIQASESMLLSFAVQLGRLYLKSSTAQIEIDAAVNALEGKFLQQSQTNDSVRRESYNQKVAKVLTTNRDYQTWRIEIGDVSCSLLHTIFPHSAPPSISSSSPFLSLPSNDIDPIKDRLLPILDPVTFLLSIQTCIQDKSRVKNRCRIFGCLPQFRIHASLHTVFLLSRSVLGMVDTLFPAAPQYAKAEESLVLDSSEISKFNLPTLDSPYLPNTTSGTIRAAKKSSIMKETPTERNEAEHEDPQDLSSSSLLIMQQFEVRLYDILPKVANTERSTYSRSESVFDSGPADVVLYLRDWMLEMGVDFPTDIPAPCLRFQSAIGSIILSQTSVRTPIVSLSPETADSLLPLSQISIDQLHPSSQSMQAVDQRYIDSTRGVQRGPPSLKLSVRTAGLDKINGKFRMAALQVAYRPVLIARMQAYFNKLMKLALPETPRLAAPIESVKSADSALSRVPALQNQVSITSPPQSHSKRALLRSPSARAISSTSELPSVTAGNFLKTLDKSLGSFIGDAYSLKPPATLPKQKSNRNLSHAPVDDKAPDEEPGKDTSSNTLELNIQCSISLVEVAIMDAVNDREVPVASLDICGVSLQHLSNESVSMHTTVQVSDLRLLDNFASTGDATLYPVLLQKRKATVGDKSGDLNAVSPQKNTLALTTESTSRKSSSNGNLISCSIKSYKGQYAGPGSFEIGVEVSPIEYIHNHARIDQLIRVLTSGELGEAMEIAKAKVGDIALEEISARHKFQFAMYEPTIYLPLSSRTPLALCSSIQSIGFHNAFQVSNTAPQPPRSTFAPYEYPLSQNQWLWETFSLNCAGLSASSVVIDMDSNTHETVQHFSHNILEPIDVIQVSLQRCIEEHSQLHERLSTDSKGKFMDVTEHFLATRHGPASDAISPKFDQKEPTAPMIVTVNLSEVSVSLLKEQYLLLLSIADIFNVESGAASGSTPKERDVQSYPNSQEQSVEDSDARTGGDPVSSVDKLPGIAATSVFPMLSLFVSIEGGVSIDLKQSNRPIIPESFFLSHIRVKHSRKLEAILEEKSKLISEVLDIRKDSDFSLRTIASFIVQAPTFMLSQKNISCARSISLKIPNIVLTCSIYPTVSVPPPTLECRKYSFASDELAYLVPVLYTNIKGSTGNQNLPQISVALELPSGQTEEPIQCSVAMTGTMIYAHLDFLTELYTFFTAIPDFQSKEGSLVKMSPSSQLQTNSTSQNAGQSGAEAVAVTQGPEAALIFLDFSLKETHLFFPFSPTMSNAISPNLLLTDSDIESSPITLNAHQLLGERLERQKVASCSLDCDISIRLLNGATRSPNFDVASDASHANILSEATRKVPHFSASFLSGDKPQDSLFVHSSLNDFTLRVYEKGFGAIQASDAPFMTPEMYADTFRSRFKVLQLTSQSTPIFSISAFQAQYCTIKNDMRSVMYASVMGSAVELNAFPEIAVHGLEIFKEVTTSPLVRNLTEIPTSKESATGFTNNGIENAAKPPSTSVEQFFHCDVSSLAVSVLRHAFGRISAKHSVQAEGKQASYAEGHLCTLRLKPIRLSYIPVYSSDGQVSSVEGNPILQIPIAIGNTFAGSISLDVIVGQLPVFRIPWDLHLDFFQQLSPEPHIYVKLITPSILDITLYGETLASIALTTAWATSEFEKISLLLDELASNNTSALQDKNSANQSEATPSRTTALSIPINSTRDKFDFSTLPDDKTSRGANITFTANMSTLVIDLYRAKEDPVPMLTALVRGITCYYHEVLPCEICYVPEPDNPPYPPIELGYSALPLSNVDNTSDPTKSPQFASSSSVSRDSVALCASSHHAVSTRHLLLDLTGFYVIDVFSINRICTNVPTADPSLLSIKDCWKYFIVDTNPVVHHDLERRLLFPDAREDFFAFLDGNATKPPIRRASSEREVTSSLRNVPMKFMYEPFDASSQTSYALRLRFAEHRGCCHNREDSTFPRQMNVPSIAECNGTTSEVTQYSQLHKGVATSPYSLQLQGIVGEVNVVWQNEQLLRVLNLLRDIVPSKVDTTSALPLSELVTSRTVQSGSSRDASLNSSPYKGKYESLPASPLSSSASTAVSTSAPNITRMAIDVLVKARAVTISVRDNTEKADLLRMSLADAFAYVLHVPKVSSIPLSLPRPDDADRGASNSEKRSFSPNDMATKCRVLLGHFVVVGRISDLEETRILDLRGPKESSEIANLNQRGKPTPALSVFYSNVPTLSDSVQDDALSALDDLVSNTDVTSSLLDVIGLEEPSAVVEILSGSWYLFIPFDFLSSIASYASEALHAFQGDVGAVQPDLQATDTEGKKQDNVKSEKMPHSVQRSSPARSDTDLSEHALLSSILGNAVFMLESMEGHFVPSANFGASSTMKKSSPLAASIRTARLVGRSSIALGPIDHASRRNAFKGVFDVDNLASVTYTSVSSPTMVTSPSFLHTLNSRSSASVTSPVHHTSSEASLETPMGSILEFGLSLGTVTMDLGKCKRNEEASNDISKVVRAMQSDVCFVEFDFAHKKLDNLLQIPDVSQIVYSVPMRPDHLSIRGQRAAVMLAPTLTTLTFRSYSMLLELFCETARIRDQESDREKESCLLEAHPFPVSTKRFRPDTHTCDTCVIIQTRLPHVDARLNWFDSRHWCSSCGATVCSNCSQYKVWNSLEKKSLGCCILCISSMYLREFNTRKAFGLIPMETCPLEPPNSPFHKVPLPLVIERDLCPSIDLQESRVNFVHNDMASTGKVVYNTEKKYETESNQKSNDFVPFHITLCAPLLSLNVLSELDEGTETTPLNSNSIAEKSYKTIVKLALVGIRSQYLTKYKAPKTAQECELSVLSLTVSDGVDANSSSPFSFRIRENMSGIVSPPRFHDIPRGDNGELLQEPLVLPRLPLLSPRLESLLPKNIQEEWASEGDAGMVDRIMDPFDELFLKYHGRDLYEKLTPHVHALVVLQEEEPLVVKTFVSATNIHPHLPTIQSIAAFFTSPDLPSPPPAPVQDPFEKSREFLKMTLPSVQTIYLESYQSPMSAKIDLQLEEISVIIPRPIPKRRIRGSSFVDASMQEGRTMSLFQALQCTLSTNTVLYYFVSEPLETSVSHLNPSTILPSELCKFPYSGQFGGTHREWGPNVQSICEWSRSVVLPLSLDESTDVNVYSKSEVPEKEEKSFTPEVAKTAAAKGFDFSAKPPSMPNFAPTSKGLLSQDSDPSKNTKNLAGKDLWAKYSKEFLDTSVPRGFVARSLIQKRELGVVSRYANIVVSMSSLVLPGSDSVLISPKSASTVHDDSSTRSQFPFGKREKVTLSRVPQCHPVPVISFSHPLRIHFNQSSLSLLAIDAASILHSAGDTLGPGDHRREIFIGDSGRVRALNKLYPLSIDSNSAAVRDAIPSGEGILYVDASSFPRENAIYRGIVTYYAPRTLPLKETVLIGPLPGPSLLVSVSSEAPLQTTIPLMELMEIVAIWSEWQVTQCSKAAHPNQSQDETASSPSSTDAVDSTELAHTKYFRLGPDMLRGDYSLTLPSGSTIFMEWLQSGMVGTEPTIVTPSPGMTSETLALSLRRLAGTSTKIMDRGQRIAYAAHSPYSSPSNLFDSLPSPALCFRYNRTGKYSSSPLFSQLHPVMYLSYGDVLKQCGNLPAIHNNVSNLIEALEQEFNKELFLTFNRASMAGSLDFPQDISIIVKAFLDVESNSETSKNLFIPPFLQVSARKINSMFGWSGKDPFSLAPTISLTSLRSSSNPVLSTRVPGTKVQPISFQSIRNFEKQVYSEVFGTEDNYSSLYAALDGAFAVSLLDHRDTCKQEALSKPKMQSSMSQYKPIPLLAPFDISFQLSKLPCRRTFSFDKENRTRLPTIAVSLRSSPLQLTVRRETVPVLLATLHSWSESVKPTADTYLLRTLAPSAQATMKQTLSRVSSPRPEAVNARVVQMMKTCPDTDLIPLEPEAFPLVLRNETGCDLALKYSTTMFSAATNDKTPPHSLLLSYPLPSRKILIEWETRTSKRSAETQSSSVSDMAVASGAHSLQSNALDDRAIDGSKIESNESPLPTLRKGTQIGMRLSVDTKSFHKIFYELKMAVLSTDFNQVDTSGTLSISNNEGGGNSRMVDACPELHWSNPVILNSIIPNAIDLKFEPIGTPPTPPATSDSSAVVHVSRILTIPTLTNKGTTILSLHSRVSFTSLFDFDADLYVYIPGVDAKGNKKPSSGSWKYVGVLGRAGQRLPLPLPFVYATYAYIRPVDSRVPLPWGNSDQDRDSPSSYGAIPLHPEYSFSIGRDGSLVRPPPDFLTSGEAISVGTNPRSFMRLNYKRTTNYDMGSVVYMLFAPIRIANATPVSLQVQTRSVTSLAELKTGDEILPIVTLEPGQEFDILFTAGGKAIVASNPHVPFFRVRRKLAPDSKSERSTSKEGSWSEWSMMTKRNPLGPVMVSGRLSSSFLLPPAYGLRQEASNLENTDEFLYVGNVFNPEPGKSLLGSPNTISYSARNEEGAGYVNIARPAVAVGQIQMILRAPVIIYNHTGLPLAWVPGVETSPKDIVPRTSVPFRVLSTPYRETPLPLEGFEVDHMDEISSTRPAELPFGYVRYKSKSSRDYPEVLVSTPALMLDSKFTSKFAGSTSKPSESASPTHRTTEDLSKRYEALLERSFLHSAEPHLVGNRNLRMFVKIVTGSVSKQYIDATTTQSSILRVISTTSAASSCTYDLLVTVTNAPAPFEQSMVVRILPAYLFVNATEEAIALYASPIAGTGPQSPSSAKRQIRWCPAHSVTPIWWSSIQEHFQVQLFPSILNPSVPFGSKHTLAVPMQLPENVPNLSFPIAFNTKQVLSSQEISSLPAWMIDLLPVYGVRGSLTMIASPINSDAKLPNDNAETNIVHTTSSQMPSIQSTSSIVIVNHTKETVALRQKGLFFPHPSKAPNAQSVPAPWVLVPPESKHPLALLSPKPLIVRDEVVWEIGVSDPYAMEEVDGPHAPDPFFSTVVDPQSVKMDRTDTWTLLSTRKASSNSSEPPVVVVVLFVSGTHYIILLEGQNGLPLSAKGISNLRSGQFVDTDRLALNVWESLLNLSRPNYTRQLVRCWNTQYTINISQISLLLEMIEQTQDGGSASLNISGILLQSQSTRSRSSYRVAIGRLQLDDESERPSFPVVLAMGTSAAGKAIEDERAPWGDSASSVTRETGAALWASIHFSPKFEEIFGPTKSLVSVLPLVQCEEVKCFLSPVHVRLSYAFLAQVLLMLKTLQSPVVLSSYGIYLQHISPAQSLLLCPQDYVARPSMFPKLFIGQPLDIILQSMSVCPPIVPGATLLQSALLYICLNSMCNSVTSVGMLQPCNVLSEAQLSVLQSLPLPHLFRQFSPRVASGISVAEAQDVLFYLGDLQLNKVSLTLHYFGGDSANISKERNQEVSRFINTILGVEEGQQQPLTTSIFTGAWRSSMEFILSTINLERVGIQVNLDRILQSGMVSFQMIQSVLVARIVDEVKPQILPILFRSNIGGNLGKTVEEFQSGLSRTASAVGSGDVLGTVSGVTNLLTSTVGNVMGGVAGALDFASSAATSASSNPSGPSPLPSSLSRIAAPSTTPNTQRRNVLSGLTSGVRSVVSGVVSGATGIIAEPIQSVNESGASGLVPGLFRGIRRGVVAPVAGVTRAAADVLHGIGGTVQDVSRVVTSPLSPNGRSNASSGSPDEPDSMDVRFRHR